MNNNLFYIILIAIGFYCLISIANAANKAATNAENAIDSIFNWPYDFWEWITGQTTTGSGT